MTQAVESNRSNGSVWRGEIGRKNRDVRRLRRLNGLHKYASEIRKNLFVLKKMFSFKLNLLLFIS